MISHTVMNMKTFFDVQTQLENSVMCRDQNLNTSSHTLVDITS